jgi:hypothetical protein
MSENEVVWAKRDSAVTTLTCWKRPFKCEWRGCGKETYLTSEGLSGFHHPVCETHYKELHAYHIAISSEVKELRL